MRLERNIYVRFNKIKLEIMSIFEGILTKYNPNEVGVVLSEEESKDFLTDLIATRDYSNMSLDELLTERQLATDLVTYNAIDKAINNICNKNQ